MKRNNIGGFIALAGVSALTNAAYATQPPCATSDSKFNTACGTNALLVNTGLHNTAIGHLALLNNTSGSFNTASGSYALDFNSTGSGNTATGYFALVSNTTGTNNTATGMYALYSLGRGVVAPSRNTADGSFAMNYNLSGSDNTAVGFQALRGAGSPTYGTGSFNTAIGSQALVLSSTGANNSAGGFYALHANTSGSYNTAFGTLALKSSQTVNGNSAFGYYSLGKNTIGSSNTALGSGALEVNTQGSQNTASGNSALLGNTTGSNNTAMGFQALNNNTAGSDNIAVGYQAGLNVKTGNNNIEIGNKGAASDGKLIKIGTEGLQTKTIIAGIYNVPLSGNAVVVTSTGQLGVAAVSSERFKTDIAPMGARSGRLKQLRPVTFKLKSDATGSVQYGLIAEEVAKVYPELVIRDGHGRIDGVRYDELAPMLLNEMQKVHSTVATLVAQHEADAEKIASLERKVADVDDLKRQLSAVIKELKARDNLVAQR